MKRLILGTTLLAALAACDSSLAADWRQFRGNAANSVAVGESLPTELSGETIAWKTFVLFDNNGVSSQIW